MSEAHSVSDSQATIRFDDVYQISCPDQSDADIESEQPIDYPSKILIVDDVGFNINALMIILKYSVRIDTKNLC